MGAGRARPLKEALPQGTPTNRFCGDTRLCSTTHTSQIPPAPGGQCHFMTSMEQRHQGRPTSGGKIRILAVHLGCSTWPTVSKCHGSCGFGCLQVGQYSTRRTRAVHCPRHYILPITISMDFSATLDCSGSFLRMLMLIPFKNHS